MVSLIAVCLSVCPPVSGVAAVCEQQTGSAPVSGDEGQRPCALLSAVRRHIVQSLLVIRLSPGQRGRPAGPVPPCHTHGSAQDSDRHRSALRQQPPARVRSGSCARRGPALHDLLTCCVCVCRFLTMDQTRKLLLLLESDPKASSLPLVGL